MKGSLAVLRVVYASVLVILSVMTLIHGAYPGHPAIVVEAIACAELVGALLLLMPKTVGVGALTLLVAFAAAITVHLLHGEWSVGPLVIDAAVAQVFLRA